MSTITGTKLLALRNLVKSASNGATEARVVRVLHRTLHNKNNYTSTNAATVVWSRHNCGTFSLVRPFSTTEKENENTAAGAGDIGEPETSTEKGNDDEKEENNNNNDDTKAKAVQDLTVEEKLVAQVKDLKDQLLRSLAEQENTRRIAKRDVESARSFAVSSFAKSMLDTSDNLSRAMAAVDLESTTKEDDASTALRTLYEGIQMTDAGLTKAFVKHGLKNFGKVGEVFDPNKHEALFEYADDAAKPGTVGQIMKVGFELNGRVIRSAEVGVIKK